jgi:hypothetical protein
MLGRMQVTEICISLNFYLAVPRQNFNVHLFDLKRSNVTLFVVHLAQ